MFVFSAEFVRKKFATKEELEKQQLLKSQLSLADLLNKDPVLKALSTEEKQIFLTLNNCQAFNFVVILLAYRDNFVGYNQTVYFLQKNCGFSEKGAKEILNLGEKEKK